MMTLGCVKILISTEECSSLKEKRQVILSIKDRLKKRFNFSVAEIDFQDHYHQSLIGMVCVSNSQQYVNGLVSKAIDYIEKYFPGRLIDYQMEIDYK